MEEKKDRDPSHSNDLQSGPVRHNRGVKLKPVVIIGFALLIIAAAVVVLLLKNGTVSQEGRPVPAPSGEAVPSLSTGSAPNPGEITLTLPTDQLANAQIKTEIAIEQAGPSQAVGGLRTTGTVSSNAYKETPIFP